MVLFGSIKWNRFLLVYSQQVSKVGGKYYLKKMKLVKWVYFKNILCYASATLVYKSYTNAAIIAKKKAKSGSASNG